MHSGNDSDLIYAVQQGDIQAFETLVKRYQEGLFRVVMRYVRDGEAASDVVQDAFIKVYRVIDRIDPRRKFSTYLFEVAKNTAISALRTKKRTVSLEEVAELEADVSFLEAFTRDDQAIRVKNAVKKLPDKYRKVISLYYFDDVSYEGISKKLRLPINTVRTHMKRAKEILRKVIPYET